MKKKIRGDSQIFSKEIASVNDFEKKVFTIPEILRIANITRRQITHWNKDGLLKSDFQNVASHDGKISFYFSRAEVIKLLIFCEMKNKGFSTQQIKKVAHNLIALHPDFEKSGTFILSDGYSVYFAETEHQVIDIWKHARQMILIEVEGQIEKLRAVA
jgi:DNA-binding transcriptional MerR regulator